MKKRTFMMMIWVLIGLCCNVQAESLRTASGAGYKKIVEQWAGLYEQETGKKIERIYGNMGQVTAQVQHGGGICLVIGDKSYLSSHNMPVQQYIAIGQGRPALVTRKGLTLASVADLAKPEYAKISAPDFQKAIYGKAAYQLLTAGGYDDILKKVIEAGTVPRSGAYSISGEVDASFINLTFALANRDKFGSIIELKEGFQPIEIVAGIINGCEDDPEVAAFIRLLDTDSMREKLSAAGL